MTKKRPVTYEEVSRVFDAITPAQAKAIAEQVKRRLHGTAKPSPAAERLNSICESALDYVRGIEDAKKNDSGN